MPDRTVVPSFRSASPSGFPSAFYAITSLAYMMLMTNVLIGLITVPFVVVYVTTDLADTWQVLLVAAPLAAPVGLAAFRVMTACAADGSAPVVRTFLGSLWSGLGPAVRVGLVATAVGVVLVVDIGAVWGTRWGAVAIPTLVVLLATLVATTATALVALAAEPEARLRTLWRVALILSVRRWYLSIVSVAALALLVELVIAQPAAGLGLTCAPVLYVVWANARFTLRPVLTGPGPVR